MVYGSDFLWKEFHNVTEKEALQCAIFRQNQKWTRNPTLNVRKPKHFSAFMSLCISELKATGLRCFGFSSGGDHTTSNSKGSLASFHAVSCANGMCDKLQLFSLLWWCSYIFTVVCIVYSDAKVISTSLTWLTLCFLVSYLKVCMRHQNIFPKY